MRAARRPRGLATTTSSSPSSSSSSLNPRDVEATFGLPKRDLWLANVVDAEFFFLFPDVLFVFVFSSSLLSTVASNALIFAVGDSSSGVPSRDAGVGERVEAIFFFLWVSGREIGLAY